MDNDFYACRGAVCVMVESVHVVVQCVYVEVQFV